MSLREFLKENKARYFSFGYFGLLKSLLTTGKYEFPARAGKEIPPISSILYLDGDMSCTLNLKPGEAIRTEHAEIYRAHLQQFQQKIATLNALIWQSKAIFIGASFIPVIDSLIDEEGLELLYALLLPVAVIFLRGILGGLFLKAVGFGVRRFWKW
jgi:hypothetical protein